MIGQVLARTFRLSAEAAKEKDRLVFSGSGDILMTSSATKYLGSTSNNHCRGNAIPPIRAPVIPSVFPFAPAPTSTVHPTLCGSFRLSILGRFAFCISSNNARRVNLSNTSDLHLPPLHLSTLASHHLTTRALLDTPRPVFFFSTINN